MKLKRFLSYMAFGLVVALPFTACDDDDDNWQAGAPVDANSIGAYFAAENVNSIVTTPEEFTTKTSFDLVVRREVTTNAASVAIEVVNNPGKMTVPSTVEFAAGEAEATITIDYSAIPQKEKCELSLRLDEKMTNPYKEQDGLPTFSGSVLVSEWVKIGDQVEFTNSWGTIKQDIYHLDGINLFRIDNFFGTGIDFQFYVVGDKKYNNSTPSTWSGYIEPAGNAYMDDGFWYMWLNEEDITDENEGYATGQIAGRNMLYLGFFYGSGYCKIDFSNNTELNQNYMLLTPFWYDENDNYYAEYMYIYWK